MALSALRSCEQTVGERERQRRATHLPDTDCSIGDKNEKNDQWLDESSHETVFFFVLFE